MGDAMRQLTDHIVEGDSVNHQLRINVLDQPGAGGACHLYEVSAPARGLGLIQFQNGAIKGLTHEALLAIIIDRMRAFQNGPFACTENALALTHCEGALDALQHRTRERIARGVEGTHEK